MDHRSLFKLVLAGITCLLLVGNSVVADATVRAKRRKPVIHFRSEVKLSPGQQVPVPKTTLRITFTTVANDSRCPSDVTCVWAGNAAVELVLSGSGNSKRTTVTLNTSKSTQFVSETIYQGYKVKLVDLSPYPRSKQKIAMGDYQATLLISKG